MKNNDGGFVTNNGNMTKVMYVMMINGMVESCMAIYEMAMEMP